MCGILGAWFTEPPENMMNRVTAALKALQNRGPDASHFEYFQHHHSHVLMAHTRLSIIDLSDGALQPMQSFNRQVSLIFNGEIYNYRELRNELKDLGYSFHSESDTEVLLNAWQQWGAACLPRLEGMFAFAVYDKARNTITLVRDAFGIKPLFYSVDKGYLLWASEQRALQTLRTAPLKVNWQRSYDYLMHADYDSQENTFIEGIRHLLPGHLMTFDLCTETLRPPERWWKPELTERSDLNFREAAECVREQFLNNIRLHLRSDVAIGAALSGGIDSSAVVCAMRHVEPDLPISSFSYVANGAPFSEEIWIDKVNAHCKSEAYKVEATAFGLQEDLDDMILAQGEPFGSTSIYAQYKVFQLAHQTGVRVVLDGQGADELLAGYQGYPAERFQSLFEQKKWLLMMRFASHWSQWPNRGRKKALMHLGRMVLPVSVQPFAKKIAGLSPSISWLNEELLQDAGVKLFPTEPFIQDTSNHGRRVIERLAASLQGRGLSELLRHGDRNSMRFSVESRVPFLTIPLANLLLSLPEHFLISNLGETKSVFREAMRGIVPEEILHRRDKTGFETPETSWLYQLKPAIARWIADCPQVPFINQRLLLDEYEAMVAGKSPFKSHLWRWINYIRWYQQVHPSP